MTGAEGVVRTFFERVAEADTDGISELLDPEIAWFGTKGGLDENRVSHGRDAFLNYLQEIEQPWEQFQVELQRVIALKEAVVVFLRETARARGGLDLQNETAMAFKVRDGKITEARGYLDRDEALAAVRLRG